MQVLQEQKPAIKKSELLGAPFGKKFAALLALVPVGIHVESRLVFSVQCPTGFWMNTKQHGLLIFEANHPRSDRAGACRLTTVRRPADESPDRYPGDLQQGSQPG